MRLADLADARVAIWGFAREGRAALKVLRERFLRKSLTVFCNEREAGELRSDSMAASTDIVTNVVDANALSRFDIVITFLAILEMAKLRMIRVYQSDPLAPKCHCVVLQDQHFGITRVG